MVQKKKINRKGTGYFISRGKPYSSKGKGTLSGSYESKDLKIEERTLLLAPISKGA